MFVLMDIEWATNRRQQFAPTQIAAMRVDTSWTEQNVFYARIRPRDSSFHQWNQVAYIGGKPSDFLYARGIYQVLTDLRDWLKDDDILCFWTSDSINILKSSFNLILKMKLPQRILDLSKYIFPYLKERKEKCGNAYQLADAFGTPAPGPKHHSECDVYAIALALAAIQYPAELLLQAPPKPPEVASTAKTPAVLELSFKELPYQYDEAAGILHKRDCSELPARAVLTGYPNLNFLLRKMLKPCPVCMAQEFRAALRARNQDIIDRTEYNFVFADSSNVFHRKNCKAILRTTSTIRGAVYYHICEEMDLRPCKLCNPTSNDLNRKCKKSYTAKSVEEQPCTLKREEQQALNRYKQARNERFSRPNMEFALQTERDDFYTLTQTRFAFWAAAGYATFHRRDCWKLQKLTNLKGFSRFQDAVRAGYTPCKHCKPNAKQDILYSIPITNRARDDESVRDLEALCKQYDYPYRTDDEAFCFSTPVGKWKISVLFQPYVVYHINLISTPDNEFYYHRQPRLFLSLLDTFQYIYRHDKTLEARTYSRNSMPQQYSP